MELCKQEPEHLESRLREVTSEAIRSIMSVQGSSVTQIPRAFGDIANPLEPLPLLSWQNVDFGGDGGYEKSSRGKTTTLRRPKLESVQRYPPDGSQAHVASLHPYKQPLQGTVISSLPPYRRLGAITQTANSVDIVQVLTAEDWRKLFGEDRRLHWGPAPKQMRAVCWTCVGIS